MLDDETFRYVYGLGRIAQVSGTATHYYLPDGLGSTMALIDAAGAVVNAYDYDVFGALRSSTGTQANEFEFAGEQVDAGAWRRGARGSGGERPTPHMQPPQP